MKERAHAAQRDARDFLLARLRADGQVVAKDVAAELGLSEDSIRRDLRELAADGLCQRVYGGALPASPAVADYADPDRCRAGEQAAHRGARRRAHRAGQHRAPRRRDDHAGGGAALPPDLGAPSSRTARPSRRRWSTTRASRSSCIGGRLFKHSAVTCGAAAVEAAQRHPADLFFLGVTGVHPDAGLTTGDADEAAMKRALAAPRRRDLRARQRREDRRRFRATR